MRLGRTLEVRVGRVLGMRQGEGGKILGMRLGGGSLRDEAGRGYCPPPEK